MWLSSACTLFVLGTRYLFWSGIPLNIWQFDNKPNTLALVWVRLHLMIRHVLNEWTSITKPWLLYFTIPWFGQVLDCNAGFISNTRPLPLKATFPTDSAIIREGRTDPYSLVNISDQSFITSVTKILYIPSSTTQMKYWSDAFSPRVCSKGILLKGNTSNMIEFLRL